MSVLIKDMKMPESCSECRFFVDAWCYAFDAEDWRNAYNKPPDGERLKDCPLEEPKTGKWIVEQGASQYRVLCSKCGNGYWGKKKWNSITEEYEEPMLSNYCPNCGSFNGGEEE